MLSSADQVIKKVVHGKHVRSFGTMMNHPEVCCEYHAANLTESVALADSCSLPAFL